jgi:hypothetical protein
LLILDIPKFGRASLATEQLFGNVFNEPVDQLPPSNNFNQSVNQLPPTHSSSVMNNFNQSVDQLVHGLVSSGCRRRGVINVGWQLVNRLVDAPVRWRMLGGS